ncbi:hypothetical protein KJ786_02420, partial [Patescibacteria group bacterium]|nr:hypothetical protein [Patescibacteria group bacterium]
NPVALNIGLAREDQEKMKIQAEKFSHQELQKILGLFIEAENKMRYSSIPELPLELAVVDFLTETA